MSFIKQFKDGSLAPLWGAKFLFTHPKILGIAILPTLINLILYAFLSYLAYSNFGKILSYVTIEPHVWYQYALYYLLGAIIAAFIITLMIFSFTIVGNIIASPFNDLITQRVHVNLGGKEVQPTVSGIGYFIRDIARMLRVELKKVIFSLSITGVAIVGSLIVPFLSFIGWTIAMVLLAFQFVDYSFELNKLGFGERIAFLFRKFFLMFGLGLSCSIFIAIPVIGFVFLPFAVIGAANLYYLYRQPGK